MANMVAAMLFAAFLLALSPSAEATWATVYGKVYCKKGGDPVSGAQVVLYCKTTDGKTATKGMKTYTTNTDGNGAYRFNNVAGTSDAFRNFEKCTVTVFGVTEDVSNNGNRILRQNNQYKENIDLAPVAPPPPAACSNTNYYGFSQTLKLVENNSKAQYRFTGKLTSNSPVETVATIVLPPGSQLTGKQCKFSNGKHFPTRKLLWYCDICVDEYTNTAVVKIGTVYAPSDSNGLAYDFTLKIKGLKGQYPGSLDGTLWTQCGDKYKI